MTITCPNHGDEMTLKRIISTNGAHIYWAYSCPSCEKELEERIAKGECIDV